MMIKDANLRSEISNLFKEMRQSRNLTQKEVGDIVKMTQGSIARLEDAWHHATVKSLSRVAIVTDHTIHICATEDLPEGISIHSNSPTYTTVAWGYDHAQSFRRVKGES